MYISSLEPNSDIQVSTLQGNGEFIVRVPCGYDDETDYVYSLFVALSPLVGYVDLPGFELVFSLIEAGDDGAHIRQIWDGNDARVVIVDPMHRALICDVMDIAVMHLIDAAAPAVVSMCTHTANLPKSALRKFNRICTVFRDNGFDAGNADSYHGQHIWMMYREANGTEN